MSKVKFSSSKGYCDRRHYLNENDVKVLLGRLPAETWDRLKAVHFNDAGGSDTLGYVNQGRREIAICALPPRVSLRWARSAGRPEQYGAIKGSQWPTLAVRRYQLYYTFIHELGHLQIIDPGKRNPNRKFADEKKAHEFAQLWRKILWFENFNHPDPVHNPPSDEELSLLNQHWVQAHLNYKKGHDCYMADEDEKAISYFEKAVQLYPNHTQALESLGELIYLKNKENSNIEELSQAKLWLNHALSIDPLLPHASKVLMNIQVLFKNTIAKGRPG